MEEHLIEILYTGYRINFLLEELEEKGIQIDFNKLDTSNWDVVVDIVGFPKDNSAEILTDYYKNGQDETDDPFVDNLDLFCRDWLFNDYFDRVESLKKEQDIYFKDDLLKTKVRHNEVEIKKVLSQHLDWLKKEFIKYNNED
ncbi:hypothetical protein JAO71_04100 [Olleya sp. YSTF-M6]|uniref:DUF4274 domain-containing protein n=1 Tax=Olleya sediminilitoris TaxID=2795739 RepID=A0ABS1WIP9_9FLAO|nr:hypothetical protein [Olleya sediminilitoris]MBL7558979.1 hypothetical protein [Olleya sediminilitoris]